MAKVCCKAWISGRVQGVFYRASTRQEAETLGVSGYAKNLSDGRVEVLACGEEEAVNALLQWCRSGPVQAQVTDVTFEQAEIQATQGFSVC